MKERDERKITEDLIEARKPENGAVLAEVLSPVMLSGDLMSTEKIIYPGAIIYLAEDEFKKLSRSQGSTINIDNTDEKSMEGGIIKFIKVQPGKKYMLENLQRTSEPIVKKAHHRAKPSTKDELKKLKKEWQQKINQQEKETTEQVLMTSGK